jgi:hypothetical protein
MLKVRQTCSSIVYVFDVPEQVLRGQLGLFNLPMELWNEMNNKYHVYSCCVICVILTSDAYLHHLQVLKI